MDNFTKGVEGKKRSRYINDDLKTSSDNSDEQASDKEKDKD